MKIHSKYNVDFMFYVLMMVFGFFNQMQQNLVSKLKCRPPYFWRKLFTKVAIKEDRQISVQFQILSI